MSSPLFTSDVLFAQRMLAAAGLYGGKIDGFYGPVTKSAEEAFDKLYADYARVYGSFGQRSEKNICTLLPKMQAAARKLLRLAKEQFKMGQVQIVSGTRTYAEQNALYAKRPKVTNAKGGQSNHNFGLAIDVGIFQNGKYLTGATRAEEKAYADLGKLVKSEFGYKSGKTEKLLDWGGDWKSLIDMPHYELHSEFTLAQKRAQLESGRAYV